MSRAGLLVQGKRDGMGFLVRAASVLLGDSQTLLVSRPLSLPRAVPAAGIEEAEARPASWGEGRLQLDHCKQDFINYKWTGPPELL